MAQASTVLTTNRCAVVSGANKGIGFEICRQLASNDISVVLTARDENKGLEAIKKLKDSGISDQLLVFHQLDVLDQTSIASLANFVKTQFGKLDILVNNAGVGVVLDRHLLARAIELCGGWPQGDQVNWDEIATQNLELVQDCLKTNYYGAKRLVEAFVPLLQLSDSPRIVNISSIAGMLENIPKKWGKGLRSDVEGLTEERIDQIMDQYLKDFKDGLLPETKGWPKYVSPYCVSKAAMNAYTRILAKKHPNFIVNSVCPGFCKTDITGNLIGISAAEGAEFAVRLALLPKDNAPSGCFFSQNQMVDF